ncbi:MAG TPA: hypothetical protein VHP34_10760, partial [Alphaproteobacteria bacterium]|nr:hypothetical protein [Alphaproteobacteria bacterium]
EHWKNYLGNAQENYTAKYNAQFDEKFANGFSIEDLQKTVNAAGDTGLTLAARARRADAVLDVAVKDGGLTLAAMFNQTAGEKSTVSLAIDRGDLAQWIRPSYWLKQDPHILKAIEEKLTEEQRKWAELDVLAAKIDQHKLKQGAGRFKLTPKR